jgi:hypothetical protein
MNAQRESTRKFAIVFARSRPHSEDSASDCDMNMRFSEFGFEPSRGADCFAGAKPSQSTMRLEVAKTQWTLTHGERHLATGRLVEIKPFGSFTEVTCQDGNIEFTFRCTEAE